MMTRRIFVALPALAVRVSAQSTGAELLRQYRFESSPWPNLHHFLYVLARARNGAPDRTRTAVRAAIQDNAGYSSLPAADRMAWEEALAVYQKDAAPLDIGYGPLVDVNYAVADLKGWAPIGQVKEIPVALRGALEGAGPVYRKLWWAAHDAANRAWIGRLKPEIERYGARIAAGLTAAFGHAWPSLPLRVEVVAYANFGGAYTTADPPLIAMGSLDEEQQGADALEELFHETSHLIMDTVDASLRSHAQASGKKLPRELSHAILFYTVGQVVAGMIPDHVPYADHYGVWERGFGRYHELAMRYWQPYLERKLSMDEAIGRIVTGL